MIRKKITTGLCLSMALGLAACTTQNSSAETQPSEVQSDIQDSGQAADAASAGTEQGESGSMDIRVNENTYTVALESNVTVDELLANMPLELNMVRYAGHEYYAELPFTPTMAGGTTSEILAGHVYYWDGWNAFVINYEDTNISPYRVVHVGEVTGAGISDYLRTADEELVMTVE